MSDFTRAMNAVRQASRIYPTFTSDDIWKLLDLDPSRRNVIGKAVAEGNRLGLIEATGQHVRSKRPESKGRTVQLWRSRRDVDHDEGRAVRLVLDAFREETP